jgi:hypothetical protein
MKYLATIALLALLVAPCIAMTTNQSSYLAGFDDGWSICYLALHNTTAYNAEALKYNAELDANLNESEAQAGYLALITPVPVLFDLSIPIGELKK